MILTRGYVGDFIAQCGARFTLDGPKRWLPFYVFTKMRHGRAFRLGQWWDEPPESWDEEDRVTELGSAMEVPTVSFERTCGLSYNYGGGPPSG